MLPLIVLVLLAGVPAGAQVSYPIDDFEVLPLFYREDGAGWQNQTQVVPIPYVGGHIISSTRKMLLSSSEDGFAQANLDLTTGNDYLTLIVPNSVGSGVGEITLTYELSPGGIDLTGGGVVDRIEADARISGNSGVEVQCRITDTANQQETRSLSRPFALDFEVWEWELADFSLVDVTDVTKIEFRFPEQGGIWVRELRLRGEGSNDINYEIHSEATFVPPIPGPPIDVVARAVSGGDPLFRAELAITQAYAGFTPELYMGWGNLPSFGGEQGRLFLDWQDLAPFEPLEFTLDFDFVPVSSAGENLVPEIFPPDPIHGPEGVALRFPMQVRNGVGGPIVYESETWINLMPGPDQAETALEFAAASVTPHGPGWTDGFSIWIALLPGPAGVETIWPVMEMDWWSDIRLYVDPTGVGEPRLGAAGDVRLTAAPTVTRSGTTLRASRPFGEAARLGIFDVTGRRLATLRPGVGSHEVEWDGRSAAGEPAPAGVYFVRLEGDRAEAARVVKLR
jgi:hypothetical protein